MKYLGMVWKGTEDMQAKTKGTSYDAVVRMLVWELGSNEYCWALLEQQYLSI